ncbi:MAG: SurA N-terminal domain-containing protein [Candidatus Binataceae bacterium]
MRYDPLDMLDKMRGQSRSWVTWILVGLPTVGLAFWGFGMGAFNEVKPIANVDGTRILSDQVDQAANQLRSRYQQEFGAGASAMLKHVNVRQEALEGIIEQQLIAQEVRRLGIEVTDAALQQRIAGEAAFRRDGQFDFTRYREVLEQNDLLPAQFEANLRAEMAEDTLREMIDQGVQVSSDEARHTYNLTHEKIGLRYAEAPYADFTAQIAPTEKQVADYYKNNGEQFREPARVKIAYIHYDPKVMAARYAPTDAEIKDYYNRNRDTRFTHPEEAHASHILIAVPAGATAAQKAKAKATAEMVLVLAKTGADFGKLAEKYSADPGSKSHGGDLGTFPRGEMVKPFDNKVFSMKPGEIAMAETQFGFHVIKLDNLVPAHTETLDEARPEIAEALSKDTGARLVHTALEEDVAAALGGTSLKSIAAKRGLTVAETGYFAQDEPATGGKDDRAIAAEAFKLSPGQPRAIPAHGAPYLIELLGRKPSRIPPLQEIEPQVRAALVRSMAEVRARAAAQKALAAIKGPDDFDRAAAENHLEVKTVDPFLGSSHDLPGIGQFPEVSDSAALAPGAPSVLRRAMDHDGNSYLFELTTRSEPPDSEWEKVETSFTRHYLFQRRQEAWSQFVDRLKDQAQIKIDADQLGSPPAST